MISHEINPDLALSICDNRHTWKYNMQPPQEFPLIQPLQHTIQMQQRIDRRQFIEEFWSPSWRTCQELHFKEIGSTKPAILWLSKTQCKVWMIAREQWQHRCKIKEVELHLTYMTILDSVTWWFEIIGVSSFINEDMKKKQFRESFDNTLARISRF